MKTEFPKPCFPTKEIAIAIFTNVFLLLVLTQKNSKVRKKG